MYQVLYRKYRPAVFEDVVGQRHVTDTLRNELKLGRVHHAYLFTGSRGTGKTTCAKILAKAVNCLDLQNCDPCGVCENCRGIDSGEILDVVEMDAASNRGIDDIRGIIDEVAFAPAKAKYRVYIVDEVHMLSRDAWNALLKTLEEPPAHVVFILATTEVNKIPDTILSRCQRFDFHRISPADISARLMTIAEKENVSLTDEAALLISVIADGALRDAISLFDRCIGISSEVTAKVVRAAAGLAAQGHLFELANCTVNKNVQRALEVIDSLYRDAKDMISLCEELEAHFRSLMLIKTVRNPRELVVMSDKEFDAAVAEADYLTLSDIIYDMDVLSRAHTRMKDSVSPRTELEMAMVKLCAPELDHTDEALYARVAALEKALRRIEANGIQPAAPAPAPAVEPDVTEQETPVVKALAPTAPSPDEEPVEEPQKPIEEPAKQPEPEPQKPVEDKKPSPPEPPKAPAPSSRKKVDMDELYRNAKPFALWQEVVANIKNYSTALGSAFSQATAYESGNYLLIDTDYEIAFELLKQPDRREDVRRVVQEITGKVYNLGPYRQPKKEETKDDVLDSFISQLKEKGVNVTEE